MESLNLIVFLLLGYILECWVPDLVYPGNTGVLVVGGCNPDTIYLDGAAGQTSLAILLKVKVF